MVNSFIPLSNSPEEMTSVFETIRVYDGKILGLDDHLERLCESAHSLSLAVRLKKSELKKQVAAVIKESKEKNLIIRPTVFTSSVEWLARPLPVIAPALYSQGVEIGTASERLPAVNAFAVGAKSNWYGPQALSYLTHLGKNFEALYFDTQGYVGELRVNNIFIIKNGVLKTPPASSVLNGVTRRLVLGFAPSLGLKAQETPLTRHELYNADDCFLTNSVLEIVAIVKMDARQIKDGLPGRWTAQIHEAYRQLIQKL